MTSPREFRILSTTAILGYGYPLESFERGLAREPHLIGVDAGSTDPGPHYLGSGKSFTDRGCVKRDLRYMLREGVRRGIPVIVGSAGGAGARPHLDWCLDIVRELAREERLSFRMGVIAADVPKEIVLTALRAGRIHPMDQVPLLTEDAVRESTHIVAQMGPEPLIRALDAGCQVVVAGRCYDPAVFAAPALRAGYPPGLAIHLGKILECAAIAATPGSGADCALGMLTDESFVVEALNPARKFTVASTAAHTLYEKSDPWHLPGPGGELSLEQCSFAELPGGRVRVTGTRFVPSPKYMIKLEGARCTGYRAASIAGTRDPIMIAQIDSILQAVRTQVDKLLQGESITGRIYTHVYGRDGVMGALEPVKTTTSHELGILIEAIAPTQAEADSLCGLFRSTLLHYGYPGRIATAGNLAFPFSPSDMTLGRVYEFSVYHLMETEGLDLFPVAIESVESGGRAV
jgi:hypothetical protein